MQKTFYIIFILLFPLVLLTGCKPVTKIKYIDNYRTLNISAIEERNDAMFSYYLHDFEFGSGPTYVFHTLSNEFGLNASYPSSNNASDVVYSPSSSSFANAICRVSFKEIREYKDFYYVSYDLAITTPTITFDTEKNCLVVDKTNQSTEYFMDNYAFFIKNRDNITIANKLYF